MRRRLNVQVQRRQRRLTVVAILVLVAIIVFNALVLYVFRLLDNEKVLRMTEMKRIAEIEAELRAETEISFVDTSEPAKTLLDMKNFKYMLEPRRRHSDVLGILLIFSYVGHTELRKIHRRSWPHKRLLSLGLRRVFVLAKIPPNDLLITPDVIDEEGLVNGDLLQGNFDESLRNMTYKHTMALDWASSERRYRPKGRPATFIIKGNDNTVFDVRRLCEYLRQQNRKGMRAVSDEFMAGKVLQGIFPNHNNDNDTSQEAFDFDPYPNHLHALLYITNPATARRLVDKAQRAQYIYWNNHNVWLTGVLRERLNITLHWLNAWYAPNGEYMRCCADDMREKGLRCEYIIGSNGGDLQMLGFYTSGVTICHKLVNGCANRKLDESLEATCTAGREEDIRYFKKFLK